MRLCCAEVAAAAVCLVVVSSSSPLSVEASADHVRVQEQQQQQQQQKLRAGEAAVDIAYRNKNSHKKDANRIRKRMEVAGRHLHEKKTPWHDPDLYGDEGGHHIVDAEPIERTQHIVGATPIELSPAPGEGRNANAETNKEDYDGEVMLHAQVESGDVDDWATRSPTASPFSPPTREDDVEVEICITEVCFLESTAFNNAYDKCDSSDDTEECIEMSYLTWKENMLGINLSDPIGTATGDIVDGTSDRPVGQFVTKNQAKNNRRKRNKKKKTRGGLSDEQIIAAGTGVKGSTAFGNKRNRQKRKNNKKRNKMYWGDRRWKKQGKMPTDVTLKIDEDMEMMLQLDLQELGLASQGDIPIDVVYGDLSTVADATDQEKVGIKGQSTSTSSAAGDGNAMPQRVPRDPVPEECRLARKKFNDAVAELLRGDEILILKSHEMETSPICTVGSGRYDAAKCLAVLKQVRQDIDQIMRGVSGDRDEAKNRISEYCFRDDHVASPTAGRPDNGGTDLQGRSADILASPPSEGKVDIETVNMGPRAHSLNKDDAIPQRPSDHQVHYDNHVFNQDPKTALPRLVPDRAYDITPSEARTPSLNKPTAQDATSTTVVFDEHVVNTKDLSNMDEVLLKDVERCKSATKILNEKRDKVHELENELQNKFDDEEGYQNIQRQIGRLQQMLDETKAEKLLYCSNGKKI